jgi:hypothetical protein
MIFKIPTIINLITPIAARPSTKRLGVATVTIFLISTSAALSATFPGYTFLPVTGIGTGNSAFSQFSGTNGVITVSHSFSSGGAGVDDNNNPLIFPSQFTMFPGTGNVQGHLAQTVYNHTSVVTFDTTLYTITPDTAFGIWNTTDEVTAPVGGNPVYRVQVVIGNVQGNPTTFNLMDNNDNTGAAGVLGRHAMVMTPINGEVTFGATINGGSGIHTDATFWNKIPTGTQKIIVYGDLPPLNTIGDGVGYYFAEKLVPEPGSLILSAVGMVSWCIFGRRRK